MYTDEDLNLAVEKGVFTDSSVEKFRKLQASLKSTPSADEENFRLIGGFNDIFIVIACLLLLFSSLWVLTSITGNDSLGLLAFTFLSWCLSEFFVLKRKMALPAIVLLLSFIGGIFTLSTSALSLYSELAPIAASGITSIAAYFHWRRFSVPITIAVGTAAVVGLLVLVVMSVFPIVKDWLLVIVFLCGVFTFALAMFWDSSDINRTTYKSDTAFWLHLLSAPMIIHPIFSGLGVLSGNESLSNMLIVIILYVFMTSISIIIDRRALMVSSLIYVLYALSALIKNYGEVGYSFALTGTLMGGALLLLSAYWHSVRKKLLGKLPIRVKTHIPNV